jgi:hypothetical protein
MNVLFRKVIEKKKFLADGKKCTKHKMKKTAPHPSPYGRYLYAKVIALLERSPNYQYVLSVCVSAEGSWKGDRE